MRIQLNNEDLVLLLQTVIGEKVKIRGVECADGSMKVRVSLGVFPVAAEFQDIRLDSDELRLRVAGALAPTLLNLVSKELKKGEVQVQGDELRIPLPPALSQAVHISTLKLHSLGLDLEGKLLDLSALRPEAGPAA